MHHSKRHKELCKLIKSGKFDSQESLLSAVHEKGFKITQATLSRDLRRIGAVKRDGYYSLGPVGYALDGFSKVLQVKYVEPNLIVVKTSPGLAQAAASMMDNSGIGGIVGTIAGDDTIIVVIESPSLHGAIQRDISQLFSRGK
jgi:transcriptional regulator of arginine metabolism